VSIEVEDGEVIVKLTEEDIADIIEAALEAGEDTIVIDLSELEDVVTVTLPGDAWESFGEAEMGLEIVMNLGKLSFDLDAVLNIAGIADGADIALSMVPVETDDLLPAQQNVINENDIVVRITLTVDEENISQLGGELAVTLPYEGELPVNAWRVTPEGTLELLNAEYDPETSTVTFTTVRLSVFAVGIRPEAILLTPMSSDSVMRFAIGQAEYTYNGTTRTADAAPFIDEAHSRTMVPLRVIAESMGAKVDWVGDTRTVEIGLDDISLSMPLGVALPDGMGEPIISNDRTFVPIAYVAQMLGGDVRWDGDNKAVYISK
jgi:hypothetical protein